MREGTALREMRAESSWAWLRNNHLGPQPGPGAPGVSGLLASKHLSSSCEELLLKTFKCSLNVFPFPPAYSYYFDIYQILIMYELHTKINEKNRDVFMARIILF